MGKFDGPLEVGKNHVVGKESNNFRGERKECNPSQRNSIPFFNRPFVFTRRFPSSNIIGLLLKKQGKQQFEPDKLVLGLPSPKCLHRDSSMLFLDNKYYQGYKNEKTYRIRFGPCPSGSTVFAMDEEMMMEAPAPSVTVGGSGKIGIKNVDDSSKPDAEQFKLVRAYKVTFDSTGTTDGGLMFRAGMSIRDDTGETDVTNSEGESVQGPAVKGSYVFVGGADGVWKLQFGGNDPGIDLAGGFGVADDHFDGGNDATMSLSGSFGDTQYRITAADPKAMGDADDDWSIGVSHSINTIKVGVGMDSEDGLAIGVGTDLSGVSTFVYWSKSEHDMATITFAPSTNPAFPDRSVGASQEYSGLGVKASMSAGEGATFSIGYSTLKLEQADLRSGSIIHQDDPTGNTKTKLIEVDFSYDLDGGATLTAGIDKKDAGSISPVYESLQGALNGFAVQSTDTTTLETVIAFSF